MAEASSRSQKCKGVFAPWKAKMNHAKDLNRNGELDPYEDWRRPVEERIDDLVSRMTLEEKAGLIVPPPVAQR